MKKRSIHRVLTAGLFISIVLLFSGCERHVETIAVEAVEVNAAGGSTAEAGTSGAAGGGQVLGNIPLKERPGVPPEEEGSLLPAEEGFASPRYEIRYEKAGFDAGSVEFDSLLLSYRSSVALALELQGEDDQTRRITLPAEPQNGIQVLIPLHGQRPRFFTFTAEGADDAMIPDFELNSVSLRSDGASEAGDASLIPLVRGFEAPRRFTQTELAVEYSYRPQLVQADLKDGERNVAFELREDTRAVPFRLYVREGTHTVYFYSRDLPLKPDSIALSKVLPGFRIEKVAVRPVSLLVRQVPIPIPADMGTLLRYDTAAWRRSDYELFSWNLFPHILVFDFRDYDLQSAFLKRLSFFVEKKGSTGRLLPNGIIDPLHGWNAHDYRAEDLARFFQQAAEQSFQLNDEEYLLRSILLNQGIIRREGEELKAGKGGILSISRQSSDRLRYLFITHEGYHGLYFASQEYRSAVDSVWQALSDDEKEFWRVFLDWKLYEVKDTDLVMNEFQAYLMQQHLSYVDTYFKEYTIPRFVRRFPEYSERADFFLDRYPDHFMDSAQKIQKAAQAAAGISAGDLVCLRESPVHVLKSEDLSP